MLLKKEILSTPANNLTGAVGVRNNNAKSMFVTLHYPTLSPLADRVLND